MMSGKAAYERATSLNCGSIQIQITYVFPFWCGIRLRIVVCHLAI